VANGVVLVYKVFDLPTGMDYRTVIPSPKRLTYFLQRVLGKFPAQVHGDLSGNGDVIGPPPT
jgi:hypothetical protein